MREKKRVDDEWKRRAAEEKAKIAGQFSPPSRSEPEASGLGESGSSGGDPGDATAEGSTDPNFVRLISTLGGQAMMALGMAEDPQSGEPFAITNAPFAGATSLKEKYILQMQNACMVSIVRERACGALHRHDICKHAII